MHEMHSNGCIAQKEKSWFMRNISAKIMEKFGRLDERLEGKRKVGCCVFEN